MCPGAVYPGVPRNAIEVIQALCELHRRRAQRLDERFLVSRNEKVVGSIATGGSLVISQEIGDSPDLRLWVRASANSGWVLWVLRWVGSPWRGRW